MRHNRTHTAALGALAAIAAIGTGCGAAANAASTSTTTATRTTAFTVGSPVMSNGGTLPTRFTCDGAGVAPPITWSSAPSGTSSYAVIMDTPAGPARAGDPPSTSSRHASLVRYGLPASMHALAAGQTTRGSFGINSVNGQRVYAPPCSQGPGAKQYTITVYALRRAPRFATGSTVTRDTLVAAIKSLTLGSAALTVNYTRA
jgi:phosphatidylethanolamine-binding protein (PEBP) family uncharacterized protein